jgi:MFS family permease
MWPLCSQLMPVCERPDWGTCLSRCCRIHDDAGDAFPLAPDVHNRQKTRSSDWHVGGRVFSGVAIGPLIGGALLSHFWWGSVFLINVPVVVLALIFTPFIVPVGSRNPERQLDLLNSLLAMVAMVSLVYALMEVQDQTQDCFRPLSRASSA